MREAKARIDDIKKSLEDVRAGIIPKESENDAAFSFAAAIEEQEKSLKEAQSEYNTLIGYDSKKAERDADAVLKVREEAEKAEFAAWHKAVDDAKAKATQMGVEFITVDVNEFRNKVLPLHQQLLDATPELKPLYEAAEAANQAG